MMAGNFAITEIHTTFFRDLEHSQKQGNYSTVESTRSMLEFNKHKDSSIYFLYTPERIGTNDHGNNMNTYTQRAQEL